MLYKKPRSLNGKDRCHSHSSASFSPMFGNQNFRPLNHLLAGHEPRVHLSRDLNVSSCSTLCRVYDLMRERVWTITFLSHSDCFFCSRAFAVFNRSKIEQTTRSLYLAQHASTCDEQTSVVGIPGGSFKQPMLRCYMWAEDRRVPPALV